MADYSKAVETARARRSAKAGAQSVEIEWFIDEVCDKVNLTLKQRVKLAVELVHSKITSNVSIPVVRQVYTRHEKPLNSDGTVNLAGKAKKVSRSRVIERSKPGEFPRADLTQLMKSLFSGVDEPVRGFYDGFIGTPLDYAVVLELQMNRSFLLRTFNEERSKVMRILSGPIA